MSGRKNRKAKYNPDEDPWDDRALIQAYEDAVKLHTSLVNAPASVLEALQQNETVPISKKRQHFESTAPKKSRNQSEEQEESEESSEDEQGGANEANFEMEHQIPGITPYSYAPYGPPYSAYLNAAYNPWATGFEVNTPTKPVPSKKSKTSSSRSQSASMDISEAGLTLEDHQEGNSGISEEDEFSRQIPKAKRAKRSKEGIQESNAAYSMYSPMGLQPPRMGDVPMGYQGGYHPQPPPHPNWWSHMPGPWSHGSGSINNTPDNATLWAYYYYGYAMGQYDAINLFSQKTRQGHQ